MGYLLQLQHLNADKAKLAQTAIQTVIELLPPDSVVTVGWIIPAEGSIPAVANSIVIAVSATGQWTTIGAGGHAYHGGEHAQAILEGAICGAVLHNAAAYVVQHGQSPIKLL